MHSQNNQAFIPVVLQPVFLYFPQSTQHYRKNIIYFIVYVFFYPLHQNINSMSRNLDYHDHHSLAHSRCSVSAYWMMTFLNKTLSDGICVTGVAITITTAVCTWLLPFLYSHLRRSEIGSGGLIFINFPFSQIFPFAYF